jgi:hypothetical protein
VENELKELLRERAEEARIEPAIPGVVLRRARRRRAGTVALTGLLVVAVAGGTLIGVRAARDREGITGPAGRGGWQGIWPQDTHEEAFEVQEVVNARVAEEGLDCTGDVRISCLQDDVLWQLDAREVIARYAVEVRGWQEASISADIEELPDEPGPIQRLVNECPPETSCDPQHSALVTVERLLRTDRFGLWFVTAWEQPAPTAAVVAFVSDYLQARVAASGAEAFLSTAAERTYREEQEGLTLYGGERGVYGGFDIYTHPREAEDGWSIVVLVKWPDRPNENDRVVAETLQLGRGLDVDGQSQPLLVLSVSRDRQTEEEVESQPPSPDAADLPPLDQVEDFVQQFMEARSLPSASLLHDLMSSQAKRDYESGRGGLSLNAPEGGSLQYEIVDIEPVGNDRFQAHILVTHRRGSTKTTVLESVLVGPGQTLRGDHAPLVILEASAE